MLKLSKKTDYAIILLAHLAENKSPVSANEVSCFYNLPHAMVANILKQLVTSGLVKSLRGQNGGYILGRSIDNINLSEIIRVTDNAFELVECVNQECACKVHHCCPTRGPLVALHKQIDEFVKETTLASFIEKSKPDHFNLKDSSYYSTHIS